MSHYITFMTIFVVANVAFGTRDEFTCVVNQETNVCWFRNLARNISHPNFVAKSDDLANDEVTRVYLGGGHGSHMHVLTSDICTAFPNLKDFNGQLLYLHEMESDVFDRCPELEVVNLEVNRLETLNIDLFKNNRKLKKIYLGDNLLKNIDLTIFEGLSALEELDLNKNLLKVFSVMMMPKLPQLHGLYLQNNLLTEFDVQKLYEKCPKMAEHGSQLRLCPGNHFEKSEDSKFSC